MEKINQYEKDPHIYHLSHIAEQIKDTRQKIGGITSGMYIKNHHNQHLISGRIYQTHEPLIAMYSNNEDHNILIDQALATLVVLDNLKRSNGRRYKNRVYIEDQTTAQEVYKIINTLPNYQNKLSHITKTNTEELSDKEYRLLKYEDEEPIQIKQSKKTNQDTVDILHISTEIEEIPYQTFYQDDDTLEQGKEQIKQKGEKGEKAIITKPDGAKEEKITKHPVDEIILRGTKESSQKITEPIAYQTEYKNDDTLETGKEFVQQEGVNGEKEVTIQIDGSRIESIIKPAINKIIIRGTKEEVKTTTQKIPYNTTYIDDDTLRRGKKLVQQTGRTGKREITRYPDGRVTNRIIITKVDKIVKRGTKPKEPGEGFGAKIKDTWNRFRENVPVLSPEAEERANKWLGYSHFTEGDRKRKTFDIVKTPFTPILYYVRYKGVRKGFSKKDN